MPRSLIVASLALAVAGAGSLLIRPAAAAGRQFTLEQVLSFPFPEHLVAAPTGATIAWTFNERGIRNIYIAQGPAFQPRPLTRYDIDDGQELTNLSFSDDGRQVVFVRGGNHEARDVADKSPPNPNSSPVQPKMQVWSIAVAGGDPRLLGEGDAPAIAPRNHQVAFVNDGRVAIVPIDGSKPPQPVSIQGRSKSLTWSPDGSTLAFESNRDDHGFISLFTSFDRPVRYIAASTSRDSSPVWSPDSKQVAFVRRTGRAGGAAMDPQPWAIWIGDAASGSAREIWKSGRSAADSFTAMEDNADLLWGADDRLVFRSYQDGWPHLYSITSAGEQLMLLTPGDLMVESVFLAPDRRSIVYNANGGADKDDSERRHVFRVPLRRAEPVQLTKGTGIEWNPVVTGDGKTLAYLKADTTHPPLPTIHALDGGAARVIAADRVPADFPASDLVMPESVVIQAGDGVKVRAQLFKGSGGAEQSPAIVFVHGGPAQQMLLGWHYTDYYAHAYALNQYLVNRGFIVISVNYRLGIGYGHAFQFPDRVGGLTASEYEDVLATAKYLQTRQDVDPKRIGIWGGSYGGYLTSLALGRDSFLFSAGVDLHGVHDLVMRQIESTMSPTASEEGGEEFPWKSPVLLIHADDDRNVPFHSTVDFEQVLISKGVPVESRVIPDDVHDLLLFRSWKVAAAATADFFERKLLNPPPPK
jgi:dipeptidyl aminopeptidase/acylaminoacyl peptidase